MERVIKERHPRRLPILVALGCVGSIGTLPLLQPEHTLPITSFYSEWLAISLGIIACVACLLHDFWNRISIPDFVVTLFVLVGYIAIQHFFVDHAYPTQVLLPDLYLGWCVLLAVVVVYLRAQIGLERVVDVLAWFFLAGAVLQATAAIAQFMGLSSSLSPFVASPNPGAAAISGNLGQSNHYATQITLGVVALMYLQLRVRAPLYVVAVCILLMSIAATLSGTRSVWLYALSAAAISALAFRKTNDSRYLKLFVTAFAFLLALVIAQVSLPSLSTALTYLMSFFGFDITTLTPATAIQRGASGWEIRLLEWHKAVLIFLQQPLIGVGIGNYGWHSFLLQSSTEFQNAELGSQLAHRSHNIFFDTLAELGIVGVVLLAVLVGTWTRQFWQNWGQLSHWYIATSLLVLFVHCNLEYPHWYSYYLGVIVIFLALGEQRIRTVTFSPRLGQVGSVVSLLLIGVLSVSTLQGYRHLSGIYAPDWQVDPARTAQLLHTMSRNPLLTPWTETLMVTLGKPDRTRIDEQLKMVERVARFQPDALRVHKHITYLALANRSEEAGVLLKRFSKAYAPLVPSYVCELRNSLYAELNELALTASQFARAEVHCPA